MGPIEHEAGKYLICSGLMMRYLFVTAVAAVLLLASQQAKGATFGFGVITANNVANVAAGTSQLTVEVTDAGGGQVHFIFRNIGAAAMSICDVYFDDGTLLGIATINNGAGVDFSQGASPGNLPSGNNADPGFVATAGFVSDSNPPTQPNGVNPGETLTVTFNLINGKTFVDTLAAMTGPIGTGDDLRIGIHVQGFAEWWQRELSQQSRSKLDCRSRTHLARNLVLSMVAAGFGARRMRKQK